MILNQFTAIARITKSAQGWLSAVGTSIGQFYNNTFTTKDDLRAELVYYQDLSSELAVDQAHLVQLESDVAELQSLLDYQQANESKTIPARILARSTDEDKTILIDQGAAQGVRANMAVIIENGHLIGYTGEVSAQTSQVILLENIESNIAATILGGSQTLGLVSGQDGFLLEMSYIPQDEVFDVDDIVITSGLAGHFPRGLIIGAIEEVIQNETSAFKSARIRPIYDHREYSNVLIVDPQNTSHAQ